MPCKALGCVENHINHYCKKCGSKDSDHKSQNCPNCQKCHKSWDEHAQGDLCPPPPKCACSSCTKNACKRPCGGHFSHCGNTCRNGKCRH